MLLLTPGRQRETETEREGEREGERDRETGRRGKLGEGQRRS